MVALVEKPKPRNSYKSPLNITEEHRRFTERRERRAKDLGIALYVLGDDSGEENELRRLEEYIMENFIDLDLDVPDDVKEKYLDLKRRKNMSD